MFIYCLGAGRALAAGALARGALLGATAVFWVSAGTGMGPATPEAVFGGVIAFGIGAGGGKYGAPYGHP